MEQLAQWMKQAIDAHDNEDVLAKLRAEVVEFTKQFPLPSGQ